MLSKCANPDCNAPFQYFREGKLFQFDLAAPPHSRPFAVKATQKSTEKKPAQKVERFWLCGRCAATMTVQLEHQGTPVVVPLNAMRRAAAS